jgi:hypothetical protein
MKLSSKYVLTLLVVFALAIGGTLFAQTTKGTIAGVVTDAQGLVVPGAAVTASAAEGGDIRSTTTGSNGEYRIEALNLGKYVVKVVAKGFAETIVRDVVVNASQITATHIELKVAGTNETVTVEAGAETIQTESGELSKTIPQVDVKDLPYSTLNPYQLAVTLPGVATVAGRDDYTNGVGFSVNGLRPRANNFLIDGFDDNDNGITGQAFQPQNIESVQEVTFLTNAYAAEYGRGGGSVSNLTFRSGNNSFHGAAWEQYKGASLNAVSAEDRLGGLTRPPQFVENIFGFRFGGPILKNKLFFFASAQWDKFHGVPSVPTLSLPTAAGFQTLAALGNDTTNPIPAGNAGLMTAALGNVRAAGPQGNILIGARTACPASAIDPVSGQCQVEWGYFRRNDIGVNSSREWTARADYTLANDSVMVRYTDSYNSSSPDLFANPNSLPYSDTEQHGPSRLLGVMWSHTFSPTVLNELRFSAQQIEFGFYPTAATSANPMAHMPTIYLANTFDFFWGGFEQSTFPQGRGHKTFQFQDAVSFTRGNHTFKIGADLAVLLVKDQFPFNADGTMTVSSKGTCGVAPNTHTCTDLENYLDGYLGASGSLSRSWGNPTQAVPTNQQAYYFQDSWKLRPNFTLDYGLRYEYQPPDASNVLTYPALDRKTIATAAFPTRIAVQPDRNNFGPRVGFAYSPRFWRGIFGEDKTVFRGGWGMFYDVFFTNISNNTAAASPNAVGISVTPGQYAGRGLSGPLATLASPAPLPNPRTSVTSVDNHLANPLTHQWNFGVQRELPSRLKAEIAYVGTRGEHLWVNEQLNPRVDSAARIYTNRGSLVVRGNRADSIYHGLQTSLTRQVGNFSVRGSYTYSKSIDNGSDVFVTSGGASRWQNVLDPRSDRGPSAFNRTHRAVISYTYEVPFKHNGALKYLADGWFTSGVISFQSGTPETIYIGGYDQNGDGEAYNDRPNWGNPKAPINYSASCMSNPTCVTGVGQDDGSGQLYDWNTGAPGNLSQFRYIVTINPVYGGTKFVNGNVSRNNFTYSGRQDWNLSLGKRFMMPYREGHLLEFRMDLFNAFNHANLGVNNLNGDINSPNFLNMPLTASGGRTVSLWAKYSF